MSTAAHAGNHTGLAFERARASSIHTHHPQHPTPNTHPDDQASRLRALVEAGALDQQITTEQEHELDSELEANLPAHSDDDHDTDFYQAPQQPKPAPFSPVLTETSTIAQRRCKRIAVVSGKGGVGKSNVAVNLSIALAATGRRTALVDADLGTANADVLCGLLPSARLEHVLPELDSCDGASKSFRDIAIEAPGGFHLVPGSAGLGRIADLDPAHRRRLLTEIETLQHNRDAVLIDTSAGIGAPAIMFATWADAVVLVCTPEPTAMADAYAMLKAMARAVVEQHNDADHAHDHAASANTGHIYSTTTPAAGIASLGRRVGLVVNQVAGDDQARAAYRRIAGVCYRFLGFRPVFMGWIPTDRDLPASVVARRPLLLNKPKSKAAAHIRLLAERLADQIPIPTPQPNENDHPSSNSANLYTQTYQGTPIAGVSSSSSRSTAPATQSGGGQTAPATSDTRRSVFSSLLRPFNRRNRCAQTKILRP